MSRAVPAGLQWEHDALAADLMDARHTAGEIAIERLGRLDVAAMRLSWTEPLLTAYEVKVSRADFLSDMRSGKWRDYLTAVERLFFAVPKGLVGVEEVPEECGLIVRLPKIWRVKRRAPKNNITDAARYGFVASLLFRHYPAPWDGPARVRRNVWPVLEEIALKGRAVPAGGAR